MADRMLQFFTYRHLPAALQRISKLFGDLAEQLVETLPSNSERTVALRKLLEAKDCAVRTLLDDPDFGNPSVTPLEEKPDQYKEW